MAGRIGADAVPEFDRRISLRAKPHDGIISIVAAAAGAMFAVQAHHLPFVPDFYGKEIQKFRRATGGPGGAKCNTGAFPTQRSAFLKSASGAAEMPD
jgi:hypothetical protein